MKQQRQAMKAQARMARAQMRMQMRSSRRGSIVGPMVLLTLGVLFLLAQMGRLSWNHALSWYGSWWPLVMIAAGVILLAEWGFDQSRQDGSGTIRGAARGPRTLGSGMVFLLIFLSLVGIAAHVSTRWYDRGAEFEDRFWGHGFGGFDRLGDRHDADDSLNSTIAGESALIVRNPRGDVSVTGTSDDGQVHVSVHKQAWAWEESDAERKQRTLQPVFTTEGGSLVLNVSQVEGGQADLTIQMPRGAALTVQADRGDVSVSSLQSPVMLSANHGNVDVNGVTGNVNVHVNYSNASVSAHNVTGTVVLEGHSGSIEMTDVSGGVTLHGDFFDTTHLERVGGLVRFQTTRTQFEAARLDGTFEVATGPDLQADGLLGPVVLTTKNRNITLERVQGSVQVTNRNGTVTLTSTTPLAPVEIRNEHGSVDVGVPAGAGFMVNASTRHGEMENDFGLTAQGDDRPSLHGIVGSGGSTVSITTTDGDVTIRKTVVAPLPPLPPRPPASVAAPQKAPKTPKAPKVPAPPALAPPAPAAPPAPTG